MLPLAVEPRLRAHLEQVRAQHARDLAAGVGRVVLPFGLERKYPNAAVEWRWQFVFPASRICRDARWGPPSRYHLHESVIQRAVAHAARLAGMTKGYDVRTVQELLGHTDVATTMPYLHVLNRGELGVRSPLDRP
jgi:integrase